MDEFLRTEMLIGKDGMEKIKDSHVAIFGIGGVGGYSVEALARSGISSFDLIDNDTINVTNINRQIIATHSSVGLYKVDVMKERILDINPQAKVNTYKEFVSPDNIDQFPFDEYDYVIDAIDTISAKIALVLICQEKEIPILSCMGAGNKMDPTKFKVSDLFKTKVCPLAKVMRHELKKRGVKHLKVVYSQEQPMTLKNAPVDPNSKKTIPGSTAFVPSVAGLVIASEVIKDLTK